MPLPDPTTDPEPKYFLKTDCPQCRRKTLVHRGRSFHYLSGYVSCTGDNCTYRRSFVGHIADAVFQVEPLPAIDYPLFHNLALPAQPVCPEETYEEVQPDCVVGTQRHPT